MGAFRRIANLFRRSSIDSEIAAELQAHIDLATEANMQKGQPPAVARRDALLRFGNPTSTRERVTAADTHLNLDGIVRDIRYAFRQLIHAPGFALTAIVTLAVAIGANAVVFSILNALVLRPLDLPGARQLYTIEMRGSPINSYPDFRDLRDRNRSFDGVALYNYAPVGLDTGSNPQQAWIYETSGNYFDVLGVQPVLGRFFHASDEHGPDSSPYIVLSYAYWQTRFHADSAVVGRAVQINRHGFTILGVAPPRFRGSELIYAPDFWVPIVDQAQIEGSNTLEDRNNRGLWIIGRLKPQYTVPQAEDDLNRIAADLKKLYPVDDDGAHFALARPGLVGNMLGGPVRAFVAGLMALSALILLAACANLGSLFAARASDRTREIALRLALGSNRSRIVRQLLAEALLIALAGGTAGIAASVVLLRALSAWQPLPQFPINVPVNPDATTYVAAAVLALISGILCGLAPVRQVFKSAPWEAVKSRVSAAGSRRFVPRDILLVVQITICAVLMTSSFVAVRGLERSLHSNFGFEPHQALLISSDLNMAGYSGDRVPAMQRRMLDATAALPGVTAAGLIDNIPLGLGWSETGVYRMGTTDFRTSNEAALPMQYSVSPGYLRAAGARLLAGRDVDWHDTATTPAVAIVNREFARKVFGSVNAALGAQFFQGAVAHTRIQVIGVVEDGRYMTLTEDPRPAFFRPLLQLPSTSSWLVVRTTGASQGVAGSLHDTIRGLDDALPFDLIPWDSELSSALFAARAATVSLGVLGLLGALLAATGIFGLASYSVSKRLKEMGIRMALGAGQFQVLRAALGRATLLLVVGSAAGLILGTAATHLLSYIVYQATPRDPVVLLGAVAMMLCIGILATWAPAQRAMRVDPSRLMREE